MTFKGKEVQVILSEEAAEEYNELNRIVGEELQRGVTSSVHQSIFRSIDRVKGWLKENPFAGDQVKKSQIPDYYTQKYGVTNLWRIELSNYWRLIYTIQSNEVEIIDFVLDMSEIALRTPAMLQLGGKQAISEHAQEHAPPFREGVLDIIGHKEYDQKFGYREK